MRILCTIALQDLGRFVDLGVIRWGQGFFSCLLEMNVDYGLNVVLIVFKRLY